MKKTITFIILLLVIVAGVYLYKRMPSTTSIPPTSTSTPADTTSPSQTFVAADGSLEFIYPKEFVSSAVPTGFVQEWRANSTAVNGALLAKVQTPPNYMPETNFSDARFTIGRSNDPKEITSCSKASNGEQVIGSATISGYPFVKLQNSDAGAGNRYDTISYRGIFDGDCYAIEYTIHSTNVGNYPPEQGIKEFDRNMIVPKLEDMVKSVEFMISSS